MVTSLQRRRAENRVHCIRYWPPRAPRQGVATRCHARCIFFYAVRRKGGVFPALMARRRNYRMPSRPRRGIGAGRGGHSSAVHKGHISAVLRPPQTFLQGYDKST